MEEKVTCSDRHRSIASNLREKLSSIKSFFEDRLIRHIRGEDVEITRIYHVWPGKNVFFLHGRLICGPDPRGLLLTSVSILLSSWIFAVYIGDDLPDHSNLIVKFSLVLTLIVLGNLVAVSMIDPGIIPRNEQECMGDIVSTGTNSTSRTRRKPRVIVNGMEIKLKYCRICKIFRPPRSCHCVVCDNCVDKFDHHCPWIGQCIGVRNYRFYLTFLVSALALFVYILVFCCRRIHHKMVISGSGLPSLLAKCPETLALASFSFVATLFLSCLATFHLYLIAINQTAYENYKERYGSSKSPYNKGIINNFKEVLFVPMPPSKVDFRAAATTKSDSEV
ncbi:hypothetical protein UlMin_022930 [Ulmus minor]